MAPFKIFEFYACAAGIFSENNGDPRCLHDSNFFCFYLFNFANKHLQGEQTKKHILNIWQETRYSFCHSKSSKIFFFIPKFFVVIHVKSVSNVILILFPNLEMCCGFLNVFSLTIELCCEFGNVLWIFECVFINY